MIIDCSLRQPHFSRNQKFVLLFDHFSRSIRIAIYNLSRNLWNKRSCHSYQSHLFEKILVNLLSSLIQSKVILTLFLYLEHFQSELLDFWSHVIEFNRWVEFSEVFFTHYKKLSIRFPLVSSNEFLLVDVALIWMLLTLVTTKLLRLFEMLPTYFALKTEVIVA